MEPYSYEPANRRRANGPGVRVFGSKMAESLESHANAVGRPASVEETAAPPDLRPEWRDQDRKHEAY